MLTAVRGVFDGKKIVMQEDISMDVGQEVMITFERSSSSVAENIDRKLKTLQKMSGSLAAYDDGKTYDEMRWEAKSEKYGFAD